MAKFGAALKVKPPKFYCKKYCGDPDFSIAEWNKANEYCKNAGITGIERDKILSPDLFPCEIQCESCINTVLDTQLKNKSILKSALEKKYLIMEKLLSSSIKTPQELLLCLVIAVRLHVCFGSF